LWDHYTSIAPVRVDKGNTLAFVLCQGYDKFLSTLSLNYPRAELWQSADAAGTPLRMPLTAMHDPGCRHMSGGGSSRCFNVRTPGREISAPASATIRMKIVATPWRAYLGEVGAKQGLGLLLRAPEHAPLPREHEHHTEQLVIRGSRMRLVRGIN
jgi:hypothetical protein